LCAKVIKGVLKGVVPFEDAVLFTFVENIPCCSKGTSESWEPCKQQQKVYNWTWLAVFVGGNSLFRAITPTVFSAKKYPGVFKGTGWVKKHTEIKVNVVVLFDFASHQVPKIARIYSARLWH